MAPLRIGSRPVKRAARLGAHDGDATNAWVNVIPAAASRAMFGVRISLLPYGEQSAHPRSSARNTTTCGRSAAGRGAASAKAARARAVRMGLALLPLEGHQPVPGARGALELGRPVGLARGGEADLECVAGQLVDAEHLLARVR